MENAGTTPQGTAGRKRIPNRERPTAEDEALNMIAREGEARLAAKRAARAEAREIRMKELEKQQKEPIEYIYYLGSGSRASSRTSSDHASPMAEERSEKDLEKGIQTTSSLSAATLASLSGTFSRRGSGDTSISIDTEASIREIKDIIELKDEIGNVEAKYMQKLKQMKDSSAEVEEKYKKAMVSNAQLDNEKTNFMYQVETLQDTLLELEEQLAESKRQFEEKSKDFEREKHAHAILQFQFMELKEAQKQKEELLAEIQQLQQKQEGFVREITDLQDTIEWKEKKIGQYGIITNLGVATNGEISDCIAKDGLSNSSKVVSETSHAFKVSEDCREDIRLKRLLDEREFLFQQIKKLKGQLEEKQNSKIEKLHLEDGILENGPDMHVIDLQRDATRQISDLKFKLAKSEQEITALEQNKNRKLMKRYQPCNKMKDFLSRTNVSSARGAECQPQLACFSCHKKRGGISYGSKGGEGSRRWFCLGRMVLREKRN
ncbi:leucine-rich repeat flightless-interacting protein 1 isoform X5 [Pituophis catenifer annectens]|uniref:leucine-rich repeat flightless-interacting protein 1 isoform X5 n=1 Tax=Pituophis catenifer annectens TaxID=94852 RepID=UPI003991C97B